MGHLYLGNLPHTHRWKQVIALLNEGADLSEIANASFNAALTGIKRIPTDPGFISTINTIVELAAASRGKDISKSFIDLGITKQAQTNSFDLLSAITQRISNQLRGAHLKSDVGKIAQDALLESLSKQIRSKTGSLFDIKTESIKDLTEPFRGTQFKTLMHEFYTAFTSRYLSYYLSRELPNHIGMGKKFSNLQDSTEFNRSFDLFCRQTIRITDEFTPGWVGKAVFEKNISEESVKRYANIAFKKIASEFEKSGR